jgi:RimJ/RimL family protein N-acetyltransferase
VELRPSADADRALTEALERDPAVMRELGGPRAPAELAEAHRCRVADPWWFVIVPAAGQPPVGAIGIWESEHDGAPHHEAGWTVVPPHQGRG